MRRRLSVAGKVGHALNELTAQRTIGFCLGCEDTNDLDELRRDPLLATICEKPDPTDSKRKHARNSGSALIEKSTPSRSQRLRQETKRYCRFENLKGQAQNLYSRSLRWWRSSTQSSARSWDAQEFQEPPIHWCARSARGKDCMISPRNYLFLFCPLSHQAVPDVLPAVEDQVWTTPWQEPTVVKIKSYRRTDYLDYLHLTFVWNRRVFYL